MRITSAGEHIEITSRHPWITRVLEEAAAGATVEDAAAEVDISVEGERTHEPFDTDGWEVLTRDSWRHEDQVVVRNACSSGLDVLVRPSAPRLEIPPGGDRT